MNDEVKHQLQKARLEIADQDNGMKQIDENGLMTAFTAQGLPRSTIEFSNVNQVLQELKKRGYIFVSSNLPDEATFDDISDDIFTSQNYQIVMRHATRPINPDSPAPEFGYDKQALYRDITRSVTYFSEEGIEFAPVVQHAYFDGSGYIDEVTGELVATNLDGSVNTKKEGEIHWSPMQLLPEIPALTGYKIVAVDSKNESKTDVLPDGTVRAISIDHSAKDMWLTITLTAQSKTTFNMEKGQKSQNFKVEKPNTASISSVEGDLGIIGLSGIKNIINSDNS